MSKTTPLFIDYQKSLECLTMQDEPLWARIRHAFDAGYKLGTKDLDFHAQVGDLEMFLQLPKLSIYDPLAQYGFFSWKFKVGWEQYGQYVKLFGKTVLPQDPEAYDQLAKDLADVIWTYIEDKGFLVTRHGRIVPLAPRALAPLSEGVVPFATPSDQNWAPGVLKLLGA